MIFKDIITNYIYIFYTLENKIEEFRYINAHWKIFYYVPKNKRRRKVRKSIFLLPHSFFIFLFHFKYQFQFPSLPFCLSLPVFFEYLPGDLYWTVNCYVSLEFKSLEFWKLSFLIFTKIYSIKKDNLLCQHK